MKTRQKLNIDGVATRLFAGILGAVALLAFPGGRAAAQCTLQSPPLAFEPNPPGVSRNGVNLAPGHQTDLQIYHSPSGSPRMLMMESFGYSILDLTDPANPRALAYDNMGFSGEMQTAGDGQSFVDSIGVAPDGARLAIGLKDNANRSYGSVAALAGGGVPGSGFNKITGGFMPRNSQGTAVQHVTNRYLAYSLMPSSGISPGALSVADITSIPGPLAPTNVPSEHVGRGGSYLTLAGNNVLYLDLGTIRIYDASNPGPVGNISASFVSTTLSSADFAGKTPTSFSAALDLTDPARLWVLVELSAPVSYSLVSVKGGVKTVNPQTFVVPQPAGEVWTAGGSSALIPTGNGGLVALMWAKKNTPTVVFRLFSSSVQGWGAAPGQLDIDSSTYPAFSLPAPMRGLAGTGSTINAYLPTGGSAYALSLSCVTVPAPPVDSLAVQYATCPGLGACTLKPSDTVFVGTPLLVTPTAFSLHPLTDWRFDFDWHTPAEDNVSPPRVKFPDLSYPSSNAPPASITLDGPCDPRSGGTPSTGAGCWTSVTSSGDFTANPQAGTTALLSLALEATNDLGAGNTATFPITWKIPAVRLLSPSIRLGQPLQSAADGTPLSAGYKWYFGTTPTSLALSACSGPSCALSAPFNAKGTYYYWLTVPYPTGYTSPDCGSPCTKSLGSFSVTDVALAFTGIPTSTSSLTVTATDASSVAAGVTSCGGGLQYNVCNASSGSCPAGTWQTLTLGSALGTGGSASIPVGPAAGTWWLRIRYSYSTTGSCTSPLVTSWVPSVSGVSDTTAWPIVVTPAPPSIDVRVNGQPPCAGQAGGCPPFPAKVGDTITFNAIVSGAIDPNPPASTLWTFPSASPASCAGTSCQGKTFQFTGAGTLTVTLAGYATGASVTFAVTAPPAPPVVASTGVAGAVCAGSPITLFASPDVSGATFSWTGPNGFTSNSQNPVIAVGTLAASGTYAVTRTLGGQPTSQATTTVVVNPSPVSPVPGNNGPLCAGQTLMLTSTTVAGATYAWTGPNGFTSSQQNPTLPAATAAASGTYTVTAKVSGCSTAASTLVTVNAPPPAPTAGTNGSICAGGTLALTASTIANATYRWSGPNGFTSTLQNPSIPNAAAAASGVYSVTATVNGCTGPAGTTTAAVSGVSAAIAVPPQICLPRGNTGTASVPDAGAGATYAWTITGGTITGGQATRSISFSVSGLGTTTLGVTVTAGACAPTGSATIAVVAQCGLYTLVPCRAVDTRSASGPFGGPSLAANGLRSFDLVLSACGIPPTATAVSANLTVVSPAASGALHAYPGDLAAAPSATVMSFTSGKTRANNAILTLATDGSGTIWVQSDSGGPLELVIDVNGYFE